MIITDQTPRSPLIPKDPGRHNDGGRNSTPPAPPPYDAAPQQSYSAPRTVPVADSYRQTPGRRFWKAFAIAALIWSLVGVLTGSFTHLYHHRRSHGEFPRPSEGKVEHCIGGDLWTLKDNPDHGSKTPFPYYASTSFDLSPTADLLFFLARGALASGHAEVMESAELDMVKVDVIVQYYVQDVLDQANACLLKRDENKYGVGLFTPKYWKIRSWKDQLRFDIVVRLPSSIKSPLTIKAFDTQLPFFSQKFSDLREKVDFQSLSLRSTNSPISVESIYANNATVITTNSPITGSFNTSTRLELGTTNAFINVAVGLENDNSRPSTDLKMKTANSPIEATVSLSSTEPSGGTFDVSAVTSNAHLVVEFLAQPVDSILHFEATTANSPASITLHPAYEGIWSLLSTLLPSSVDVRSVEDPSGRGRKRLVEDGKVGRGLMFGSVRWGPGRPKTDSWAKIRTSDSGAHLTL